MKTKYFVLASGLFLLAAAGVGIGLRHANAEAGPRFLQESVKPTDIEASITAMGAADFGDRSVRAAISEADISKIRIGAPAYFTRVGSNQRMPGHVISITAMPAGAAAALAASAADAAAAANEIPVTDESGDPGITANAKEQHSTKTDIYAKPKTGVFYYVTFSMDSAPQGAQPGSLLVHVVQGSVKQAPAISRLALQKQVAADRFQVEVIDTKGHLAPREITTGLTDDLSIEVKSGLALGEVVAIRDDGTLYDPGFRG